MHTSKPIKEVQASVCRLIEKVEEAKPDRKESWFYRSDTGTGKSTGFVEAVAISNSSFAIAVPTMDDVDSIYESLKAKGVDVFKWHTNSGTEKSDAKGHRVFVGSHAFLLSARNDPVPHIGERDILIVDEIPAEAKAKAVKQSDIVEARQYAEANLSEEYKKAFRRLEDWVSGRHTEAVLCGGNASFKPVSLPISGLLLGAEAVIRDVVSDTARHKLRDVVSFLQAASEKRAFQRVQRGKHGYTLWFCYFDFPSRSFNKQVVFSATCDLDGLQFSPDGAKISESEGFNVDYCKLTVGCVPYPDVPKAVGHFRSYDYDTAMDHIEAMVENAAEVPGHNEILVVTPKRIKQSIAHREGLDPDQTTFCLQRNYSDCLGNRRLVKIHFTNWGRDVGSNEYRNCDAVILWHNQHKPKHVTLSELFHYAEEEVTGYKLKPVKDGKFKGTKAGTLQDDQLYAAIKQMGARGNARNVDDLGQCGDMHLYISWAELEPERLQAIFPGCKSYPVISTHPMLRIKPKKGYLKKALDHLESASDATVTYREIFGGNKRHSRKLLESNALLETFGWRYVQGDSGGDPNRFERITGTALAA